MDALNSPWGGNTLQLSNNGEWEVVWANTNCYWNLEGQSGNWLVHRKFSKNFQKIFEKIFWKFSKEFREIFKYFQKILSKFSKNFQKIFKKIWKFQKILKKFFKSFSKNFHKFPAPSYNILKSISMTLWEIMQSRTSLFIQKTFNRSARTSFGLFDRPESREGTATTNHSGGSRTTSYSSTCSSIRNSNGLLCNRDEPITLFRLELERLQYILHFPEEVAFQVALIKYSSNVK